MVRSRVTVSASIRAERTSKVGLIIYPPILDIYLPTIYLGCREISRIMFTVVCNV